MLVGRYVLTSDVMWLYLCLLSLNVTQIGGDCVSRRLVQIHLSVYSLISLNMLEIIQCLIGVFFSITTSSP